MPVKVTVPFPADNAFKVIVYAVHEVEELPRIAPTNEGFAVVGVCPAPERYVKLQELAGLVLTLTI